MVAAKMTPNEARLMGLAHVYSLLPTEELPRMHHKPQQTGNCEHTQIIYQSNGQLYYSLFIKLAGIYTMWCSKSDSIMNI